MTEKPPKSIKTFKSFLEVFFLSFFNFSGFHNQLLIARFMFRAILEVMETLLMDEVVPGSWKKLREKSSISTCVHKRLAD